ncbi:aminotransferase [Isoalcanivorax pacificus W11-5]|uniref:Aminotransferase n=1 Tax=Isoalcanivorax pacificus W11-5 TaxID=391936 RepID=A0A0B4XPA2_9GAMM|nr:aminotransferase class V-fold PLP-dependent enzyme [Isoalcanivorax pacificus]AJD48112.1 aminotransferase [Isoalcanivorax pacificus W11-5]
MASRSSLPLSQVLPAPAAEIAAEFPLAADLCYLNHAAVAPWPGRTLEAITAFAQENVTRGAADYPRWHAMEARLRAQLCTLINAPSTDDIALLKNTSEGLSLIAAGLPWQAGDRIVTSDQEFPSNRIPWQALRPRGVDTLCVDISGDDPEGALIAALTPRTRLLSISSVQYGTGLRMDLARLGDACRANGTLFCVDAIQSLGALPFDVQACCADFVVADGHKWMLGPEGLALFYCRDSVREQLALTQYGWHMIEDAGNYDRDDWTPAQSARRFECGSPNMLATHALSASLSLLLEVGMEQVSEALLARTDYIDRQLRASGRGTVLSPADAGRRAGIVTWRPDEPLEACFERLRAAGVVCARRGGGIRLSPHFYTDQSVIDHALGLLLA